MLALITRAQWHFATSYSPTLQVLIRWASQRPRETLRQASNSTHFTSNEDLGEIVQNGLEVDIKLFCQRRNLPSCKSWHEIPQADKMMITCFGSVFFWTKSCGVIMVQFNTYNWWQERIRSLECSHAQFYEGNGVFFRNPKLRKLTLKLLKLISLVAQVAQVDTCWKWSCTTCYLRDSKSQK